MTRNQQQNETSSSSTDELALLRKENDELKVVLGRATAKLIKLASELDAARAQVAWFHRQLFGQKAERSPPDLQAAFNAFVKEQEAKARDAVPPSQQPQPALASLQLLLGLGDIPAARSDDAPATPPQDTQNEAASGQDASPPSTPGPPPSPPPKRKGHGRKTLPETLRQESIVLEPEPGEVPDGARMMGAEVSYRFGIRPAEFVRIAVVRPQYAVETDDGHTKVITADPPAEMIPRGIFAPSGLAHILAAKWDRHVPYNRLGRFFPEGGEYLSTSTLSGVGIRAMPLAKTLVEAIERYAKTIAPYLGIDPTSVLLQHPDRCVRGHAWVRYVENVCVLVSFTRTHDSDAADTQLDGWTCPTLADAASVFDRKHRETGNARGGCWSHCRRKLVYAAPTDGRALIGVKMINDVFSIEAELRDATPEVRLAERQERSAPIVERLFAWRDELLAKSSVPPRGPLAKALRYQRNQEERLMYFLSDGRIPIHNNFSELQNRHIAVGRKNWLFFGSDDGAAAGSVWLSLALTARMHALPVEPYFRDLFRVLPVWPQRRILELAPHRWLATRARMLTRELEAEFGPITIPPPLPP